jgi:hypothetical protein
MGVSPWGKSCLVAAITVVVAVAVVFLGIFLAVDVASKVSRNKMNPLSQIAPSPPFSVHGCLSSLATALGPSGFVVNLLVVLVDPVMGTGIPIFCQVMITIVLVEPDTDPASDPKTRTLQSLHHGSSGYQPYRQSG